MRVLDQNNKYGIQDIGLLDESGFVYHSQWFSAESASDFSATVGVKYPFFMESIHSDTTCPQFFTISPLSRKQIVENSI